MRYYQNMRDKSEFQVDHTKIQEYFPMNVVLNGIFKIYEVIDQKILKNNYFKIFVLFIYLFILKLLLNLEFQEIKDTNVYHEEVKLVFINFNLVE